MSELEDGWCPRCKAEKNDTNGRCPECRMPLRPLEKIDQNKIVDVPVATPEIPSTPEISTVEIPITPSAPLPQPVVLGSSEGWIWVCECGVRGEATQRGVAEEDVQNHMVVCEGTDQTSISQA